MKLFIILGSAMAFLSVALGAFGAHGLEGKLSERMMNIWQKAVTYQMFHAGGLFVVAFLLDKFPNSSTLVWAGWLMVAGILLFSGSLYVLSTTGIKVLGAITPIGGVAFLAAWILIGTAMIKG
ncbi:DUF423 domain-containing protein [Priestia taiwanensis]|uniref:Membrane protein n=1 Tax=Priestia taiwanensis TaxID=1347902 RepID=A0A917AYT7_9BACI|nr:DUF423 domain-containing protein [Priestia taiwanensis]MBM7364932.1 uncharacterized membrane protein YgdD (TMEM256/DUF423 family) [Priestia taiwanensis]GGE82426.1 membrane protein [Priestia taiwanensis]